MLFSIRTRWILALCAVLVMVPGAAHVQAQDCTATVINAQMSALVLGYVGQQATATDDAAALDLAEGLQNQIADLLAGCGRGGEQIVDSAPPASTDGGSNDTDAAPPTTSVAGAPGLVSSVNTPQTPINPAADLEAECDNRTATVNGTLVTAYLPAGDYRVTLLPERFQNFDPILFVNTGTEAVCSSESPAAREYVVDFSRAAIGRQVYGHNSGGVLEFTVEGSANDLTPVEILFGGQDRSDAGTTGEFMLIIEGARLTPGNTEHYYTVTMTESMFASDTPFAALMLGVSDVLDPNLSAGTFVSEGEFAQIFGCEDAGTLDCATQSRLPLEGTSVVQAAVRTTRGDELDAAIEVLPAQYLAEGLQEVTFIATEVNDDIISREEYVIVFYGGLG